MGSSTKPSFLEQAWIVTEATHHMVKLPGRRAVSQDMLCMKLSRFSARETNLKKSRTPTSLAAKSQI
jgi:uncharacterized protein YfaT (DUF1175 family)